MNPEFLARSFQAALAEKDENAAVALVKGLVPLYGGGDAIATYLVFVRALAEHALEDRAEAQRLLAGDGEVLDYALEFLDGFKSRLDELAKFCRAAREPE